VTPPPTQLDDIESLNYDDLGAVAKLAASAQYKDVMQARRSTLFTGGEGQGSP
jgi:hypothetical protein